MSDFPTSSINSNNPKAIRNMVIPTVIESEGRVERAYDIYSRLLKDRIVFIGSEIDPYNQISNSVIAHEVVLVKTPLRISRAISIWLILEKNDESINLD